MKFLATVAFVALAWSAEAIKFSSNKHAQAPPASVFPTVSVTTTTSTTTPTSDTTAPPAPTVVVPVAPNVAPAPPTPAPEQESEEPTEEDDEEEPTNQYPPTAQPAVQTTTQPTAQPFVQPIPVPAVQPTVAPIAQPPVVPTVAPVVLPTAGQSQTVPAQPAGQTGQPTVPAQPGANWSDSDEKEFANWQKSLVPVTIPALQGDFNALIQKEKDRRIKNNGAKGGK